LRELNKWLRENKKNIDKRMPATPAEYYTKYGGYKSFYDLTGIRNKRFIAKYKLDTESITNRKNQIYQFYLTNQREDLLKISESDIYWDEIIDTSIIYGEFEVFDITVPKNHNFIANDIGRFRTQYEAFSALQIVTKKYGWDLVLKYHPLKNNSDKNQKISKPGLDWTEILKLDHVTEIPFNSDIDTYSLIKDSALNVVWSSTVGLESISRGCPTLVLGNPHWLNKDWSIHAWTEDDLTNFFSRPIGLIPSESLYPWYWYLHEYGSPVEYFKLEGSSFTYRGKKIVVERYGSGFFLRLFRFFVKQF
jgi:hypothetical protein